MGVRKSVRKLGSGKFCQGEFLVVRMLGCGAYALVFGEEIREPSKNREYVKEKFVSQAKS